jgi:tRNA pseudouridine65 synthase
MLDTKAEKERGITKEEQEAVTVYERLDTVELPYAVSRYPVARYSLIRLLPHSGRKHQLRRHMKHIHHHMIGDTKHGRGEHNKLFREHYDTHRLLLHARKIDFKHPMTGELLSIEAGFDATFQKLFQTFGWDKVEY